MGNEQSADQHDPQEQQEPGITEQQPGPAEAGGEHPAADESASEAPASGADTDSAAAEDAQQAELAQLRSALEQAEARADENWQRVLRTEAEKDNVRKRAQKDVDSARKQALEKVANELLGVRDSLELGVDAAQQENAELAKVREGTELTLRMLAQAMQKFDIVEIDPLGEKFDPDFHQAMSMHPAEGYETNTVYQVMQKGYRLEDRLLRPALVMVAQ